MKILRAVKILKKCARGEAGNVRPMDAVMALNDLQPPGEIMPPSPQGKRVLAALQKLTQMGGGIPPTIRELGEELGIQGSTVHGHVDLLEERGYVVRPERGRRGNLIITEQGEAFADGGES